MRAGIDHRQARGWPAVLASAAPSASTANAQLAPHRQTKRADVVLAGAADSTLRAVGIRRLPAAGPRVGCRVPLARRAAGIQLCPDLPTAGKPGARRCLVVLRAVPRDAG